VPVHGLAIIAVLASALGGCATQPTASAPSGEDGLVLHLALYPPQATHDALADGRLVMSGACLFLVATDGTRYGLAWPAQQTHWDQAGSEIVVNDSRAAIGDEVWIGGGPTEVTPQSRHASQWAWVEAPRVECLGDEFWIVSSLSTEAP